MLKVGCWTLLKACLGLIIVKVKRGGRSDTEGCLGA